MENMRKLRVNCGCNLVLFRCIFVKKYRFFTVIIYIYFRREITLILTYIFSCIGYEKYRVFLR